MKEPVLAGVSGGMDSMYLAHRLLQEGVRFAVASCNFRLRGEESDGDFALVRDWADAHGIPFYGASFDTAAYSEERGISLEMAARELRYRFFGETARREGFASVAVAHNANDNAETLLLNLVRGTGLKGACGMRENAFLPLPEYADIPLVRPLLNLERADIEAAVRAEGIPYREDSTNALPLYKRNKIRNQVMPLLRELNPSVVKTLNEDMTRFADAWARLPEAEEAPAPQETAEELPPLRCLVNLEDWDGSESPVQPEGTLVLDADTFPGVPILRGWKPGDWIRPLGLHGRKKLQDWFSDRHYTPAMKRQAVLVQDPADPSHILAIAGKCIDEHVKVTARTRHIWRIVTEEVR